MSYVFLINRIMASLNLLRYLVIKDNEKDNQVSEFFKNETEYIQNAQANIYYLTQLQRLGEVPRILKHEVDSQELSPLHIQLPFPFLF